MRWSVSIARWLAITCVARAAAEDAAGLRSRLLGTWEENPPLAPRAAGRIVSGQRLEVYEVRWFGPGSDASREDFRIDGTFPLTPALVPQAGLPACSLMRLQAGTLSACGHSFSLVISNDTLKLSGASGQTTFSRVADALRQREPWPGFFTLSRHLSEAFVGVWESRAFCSTNMPEFVGVTNISLTVYGVREEYSKPADRTPWAELNTELTRRSQRGTLKNIQHPGDYLVVSVEGSTLLVGDPFEGFRVSYAFDGPRLVFDWRADGAYLKASLERTTRTPPAPQSHPNQGAQK